MEVCIRYIWRCWMTTACSVVIRLSSFSQSVTLVREKCKRTNSKTKQTWFTGVDSVYSSAPFYSCGIDHHVHTLSSSPLYNYLTTEILMLDDVSIREAGQVIIFLFTEQLTFILFIQQKAPLSCAAYFKCFYQSFHQFRDIWTLGWKFVHIKNKFAAGIHRIGSTSWTQG